MSWERVDFPEILLRAVSPKTQDIVNFVLCRTVVVLESTFLVQNYIVAHGVSIQRKILFHSTFEHSYFRSILSESRAC